jgi:DNA mismatch endonuclease Vsr
MARTDVLTPEQRSRCMANIAGKNTRPEMIIRRGLHARGWRYVLHSRQLPGQPDLVFPSRRAVVLSIIPMAGYQCGILALEDKSEHAEG